MTEFILSCTISLLVAVLYFDLAYRHYRAGKESTYYILSVSFAILGVFFLTRCLGYLYIILGLPEHPTVVNHLFRWTTWILILPGAWLWYKEKRS